MRLAQSCAPLQGGCMLRGRASLYTSLTFATFTACGADPVMPDDKSTSTSVEPSSAAAGSGGVSAPIIATPLLPRATETPAPTTESECASAKLNLTRVIPTVWLMI